MNKIKFTDLELSQETQRALAQMNFSDCTPIQSQTIPIILSGKDLTGQAQTGTGKTAAFGIPLVESVKDNQKFISALVLCPTRELVMQVTGVIRDLTKFRNNVRVAAIFGGQPITKQIMDLRKGVNIIVSTPGRLIDHMNRRTISLKNVNMLVMDEADEMLKMGFQDDIEYILSATTSEERQTILFSATIPHSIMEIARKYQNEPVLIKTEANETSEKNIHQHYIQVSSPNKVKAISQLIVDAELNSMIVFCNTKRNVDKISQELHYEGISSGKIHGDLTQRMRTDIMDKFRRGKIKILVATDVAARGIDIKEIDAVINFDIPFDPENYVHRIGRTGRAGTVGNAYSLVTGRNEKEKLKMYERMTKVTINQCVVNIPGVEALEIREGRSGGGDFDRGNGGFNRGRRSGGGGGNGGYRGGRSGGYNSGGGYKGGENRNSQGGGGSSSYRGGESRSYNNSGSSSYNGGESRSYNNSGNNSYGGGESRNNNSGSYRGGENRYADKTNSVNKNDNQYRGQSDRSSSFGNNKFGGSEKRGRRPRKTN